MKYVRKPDQDKRTARGDDFAGDAWMDTETGELRIVSVGWDPNLPPDEARAKWREWRAAEDAKAWRW